MARKRRIPVDVTEEQHKAIKELVKSRGMTIAGLVRMLLERELAANVPPPQISQKRDTAIQPSEGSWRYDDKGRLLDADGKAVAE